MSTTTTRTRTPRTRKPAADNRPKSEIARDLLKKGSTISEIERHMSTIGRPMGYAFIYGVADRTDLPAGHPARKDGAETYADVAAKRRPEKAIQKDGDMVIVQTTVGPIAVNTTTGDVTRGKKIWKFQTAPKVTTPTE